MGLAQIKYSTQLAAALITVVRKENLTNNFIQLLFILVVETQPHNYENMKFHH